jgi:hypothetical protein
MKSRIAVQLLAFSTVLLLAVGITGSWLFKKIDDDYSKLVMQTAGDLRRAHEIVVHASIGYARVAELPFAADSAKEDDLLRSVASQKAANDVLFDELEHSSEKLRIRAVLERVKSKRLVSRKEYETFLEAVRRGKQIDGRSPEWLELTAAFVDYQNVCKDLAQQIEAHSLRASKNVTRHVTRIRQLFIISAVLPLCLIIGSILVTIYLILATPIEVDLGGANLDEPKGGQKRYAEKLGVP